MKVISLLHEEIFKSTNTKDAFLKANKWLAMNVINKNLNLVWEINKISDGEVKLQLYVMIEMDKVKKSKCDACKSFHSKFYINQQFNCDKCNAIALVKTLEEKLKMLKQYNIEILNT